MLLPTEYSAMDMVSHRTPLPIVASRNFPQSSILIGYTIVGVYTGLLGGIEANPHTLAENFGLRKMSRMKLRLAGMVKRPMTEIIRWPDIDHFNQLSHERNLNSRLAEFLFFR